MRTPLYGHISQETAYMIEDYPYGRTLRCRRRVWLEYGKGKGWRFCSQTEHPTKKVWNGVHKSTYVDVAACLFMAENGHIEWAVIHASSSAAETLEFVKEFGAQACGGRDLGQWAHEKAVISKKFALGQAAFTINGVRRERTEAQKKASEAECQIWCEVVRAMAFA